MSFGSMHTVSSDSSSIGESNHQLVIDSEEIFPNPIVSKKGHINVFDQPQNRNKWTKCYVVSLFIIRNMMMIIIFRHESIF